MDALIIQQTEAVCPTIESIEAVIPEEDEAVCLETIAGGIWLSPLRPSSSTETPPAVCPESAAVPTPFTIATQAVCP